MTLDVIFKFGFGAVTVALVCQVAIVAMLATANFRRKGLVEPIAWLTLAMLIEVAGLDGKLRLEVAMSLIMICIVASRRNVNFKIRGRVSVTKRLKAIKFFRV